MSTDDVIDPRDDGPSFGRMVVDGCCHVFAEALRKVGVMLPRGLVTLCWKIFLA